MDFASQYKQSFFTISEQNFNEKALDLFKFQSKSVHVYREFLKYLNRDPEMVKDIQDIPFLPIQFFKSHEVITEGKTPGEVFYSSGTTFSGRSRHLVADPVFYSIQAIHNFQHIYGALTDYGIIAVLPSYLENPNSSLLYMVNDFLLKSNCPEAGFVEAKPEIIKAKAQKIRKLGRKVLLIGVTFALLDLAETSTFDFEGDIVMETGGMKGRRREMIREEVHEHLKKSFGVSKIHSEYGMTELLSQAYSKGDGLFSPPAWMKIVLRDVNDPFSTQTGLRYGGVNVIDLANIDSCAFIETQDLGRRVGENDFEVIGRFDNSDVRGCNLLYS